MRIIPKRIDVYKRQALLHDIGRASQYETGIPHDRAGALLAETVLKDCGFDEDETAEILDAVGRHRSKSEAEERPLAWISCPPRTKAWREAVPPVSYTHLRSAPSWRFCVVTSASLSNTEICMLPDPTSAMAVPFWMILLNSFSLAAMAL